MQRESDSRMLSTSKGKRNMKRFKSPNSVTLTITREFVAGTLKGLRHTGTMGHIDIAHAARWVRGIRKNSRLGKLDYRLVAVNH